MVKAPNLPPIRRFSTKEICSIRNMIQQFHAVTGYKTVSGAFISKMGATGLLCITSEEML